MKTLKGYRRGLTLIEVLVVIAIIGILVALLIPAVQAAREAMRRASCKNNLRQLAIGAHLHSDATGTIPASRFNGPFGNGRNSTAWSWLALSLPYLEQTNLYNEANVPNATMSNSTAVSRQVPVFLCASDGFSNSGPRTGTGNLHDTPEEGAFLIGQSNYKGVCGANWGHDEGLSPTDIGSDWLNKGTNGSWDGQNKGDGIIGRSNYQQPRRFADVIDGTSNTFFIGEELPQKNIYSSWPYANHGYATCAIPLNVIPKPGSNYAPEFWPNVSGFRSSHSTGANFALVDGSVRFVSGHIDLTIYRAMATIAGGEAISLPD
jgi:prepilin-type N-terminal cleavage/methylation domain-containing protein/prepilin-type processing-associated H-X9-DG protein